MPAQMRQLTRLLCRSAKGRAGALKSIYNSNDCVWVGAFAMDYRGVRYTIRAGIEPNLWSISIYPDGIESRANRAYGSRKDAEFPPHSIDFRLASAMFDFRRLGIPDCFCSHPSIMEWASNSPSLRGP